MIRFHLKWWTDTSRFVQGTSIHLPDLKAFLFMDASHYGLGAHLELVRLSFHGCWSEDQSQLHINSLLFRTEESHKIHTALLCHDFYRQYNSGLLYQQTRRNTFSHLCVKVWEILHWCLEHGIVIRIRHIPGKFNILVDRLSRLDRLLKTEMALDQSVANSIFKCSNFPMWIRLRHDSISNSHCMYLQYGQPCLSDRHIINELILSLCICISTNNSDTLYSSQDTSISVQNSSYCSSLASTSLVLRGVRLLVLAPICLPLFTK